MHRELDRRFDRERYFPGLYGANGLMLVGLCFGVAAFCIDVARGHSSQLILHLLCAAWLIGIGYGTRAYVSTLLTTNWLGPQQTVKLFVPDKGYEGVGVVSLRVTFGNEVVIGPGAYVVTCVNGSVVVSSGSDRVLKTDSRYLWGHVEILSDTHTVLQLDVRIREGSLAGCLVHLRDGRLPLVNGVCARSLHCVYEIPADVKAICGPVASNLTFMMTARIYS